MHARMAARALTLAGAAALVLAGAVIPASGATSPPWHVVKSFSPADGVWSANFAVSGAKDAWSTWIACGPCSGSTPVTHFYVEHSAGSAWKAVGVPASLTASAEASIAIGASSFRNLWLIDPPAVSTDATTRVLRWNGAHWHVQRIPGWAVHFNLSGDFNVVPAVFSPTSAWIFSLGQDAISNPGHYAARYNGRTWSKVQLPGIPSQVSILSPDDMWALGSTLPGKGKAAEILMHWNGRRWRTVTVPKVRVPSGSSEYVLDPVALGPADVWMQRELLKGTAGAVTVGLLHWNGRAWRRVAIPADISSVGYMTQDGHGGLWLAASGPKPAYRWYFFHFDGSWTRESIPAVKGTTVGDVIGISWIPGTRSVWAAANMFQPGTSGGIIGAILKHTA
jgi:hypothetical protein